MNYFLVSAMCGHVGKNKYIIKTIATIAKNSKQAAKQVREMPRVKHDRKDAILEVRKATLEEYILIEKENQKDPYFKVKNIQEQRRYCIGLDEQVKFYEIEKEVKKRTKERINYVLKKQKEILKDFKQLLKEDYEQNSLFLMG